MNSVIIDRLPMPPQSNNCYSTAMVKGRPIRFPSKELKDFKRDMSQWCYENQELVRKARQAVVAISRDNQVPIRVDRYFAFHEQRLFSKTGSVKMLDASNRVKCLDDALSEQVFGIDDKWFFSGVAEKVICPADESECVLIVLVPTNVKTLEQLCSKNRNGIPYVLAATLAMEEALCP